MTFKIYTFRLGIAFLVILSFQDFANGVDRQNIYKTVDIEDQCDDPYHTYVYILGNTNMSSTLKLRAYKKLGLFYSLYCHFNIRPPIGHEVVIYLEEMDLSYVFTSSKCSYAYLEIKGDNFMTRKVCTQNDQGSSFYLGKEAHLYYYGNFVKRGFTLVATAYTKGCLNTNQTFKCANGNCIWFGLVKDGVNNCGDNSDEVTVEQGKPKPVVKPKKPFRPVKPPIWIKPKKNNDDYPRNKTAEIIAITVMISLIVIAVLCCIVRKIYCMKQAKQSSVAASDAQRSSQRPLGSFTVVESRTNSSGDISTLDVLPPSYSSVMKEDMKNPPSHPAPPSYSSVTSSNSNRTTLKRRKSQPSIEDADITINLNSAGRTTPSAPSNWI